MKSGFVVLSNLYAFLLERNDLCLGDVEYFHSQLIKASCCSCVIPYVVWVFVNCCFTASQSHIGMPWILSSLSIRFFHLEFLESHRSFVDQMPNLPKIVQMHFLWLIKNV